jgi:hypothetical protein
MPALGCSRLERGVLVSVIAGEEPGSRCNAYTRHEKQPPAAFARRRARMETVKKE